ncbi:MAG TPA: hypothetical protein VGZ29_10560 [Terriglobia bacterium]|nr:hypothetical protein [Terriglobia bacterium]
MRITRYSLWGLLGLLWTCALPCLNAQQGPNAPQAPPSSPLESGSPAPAKVTFPTTLEKGTPLNLSLSQRVRIRQGEPLEGTLVQPLYSFDRMVVPAGSKVLGRIATVTKAKIRQRSRAIIQGDFSPILTPRVEFNTLLLPGGRRLPIDTSVSLGTAQVVHLETAGSEEDKKKPGAAAKAIASAKQQVHAEKQQVETAIKEPGRLHRLKEMLISELPYHPAYLAAGTRYSAELKSTIALGSVEVPAAELKLVGQIPPPGSLLQTALLTPLSSATARRGMPVEAIVTRPLFSEDHQLVVPQGSLMEGVVVQAQRAQRLKFHRNGVLRFTFNRIQTPHGAVQTVAASLTAVDVDKRERLKLDSEGGAHSTTSKMDYAAPALAILIAASSATPDTDVRPGRVYNDTSGPVGGQIIGGGIGYRLIGAAMAIGIHYRPVTAALAAYGAAWSLYSHLLTRGQEVVFPEDTPMQIRFGQHHGPQATPAEASTAKPGV